MNITARTKICMVIGDPVIDSLSPQLHNAGYEALKINDEFVYIGCRIGAADLEAFIKVVKAANIRGVSCKMPHKVAVVQYLDKIDPTAQRIGAVNTIVNDDGKLTGYNTDWIGIINPLKNMTSIEGKAVALLGAGGAARAAAYGLVQSGADLTIYNRTAEKAQELATELGVQSRSMEDVKELATAEIIINTTPTGSLSTANQIPIPEELINGEQIVFDIITMPYETRLLKTARQRGARTLSGMDMLLYQGLEQFKLYTGHDAPEADMRAALSEATKL